MKIASDQSSSRFDGPLLNKVTVKFADNTNPNSYPFSLDIIKNLKEIKFPTQVTFFVGENGTGKSTILEALAYNAGFGVEGGSKNINFATTDSNAYKGTKELAEAFILSWRYKPRNHNGYFFRAESFFNIANYIDQLAKEDFRAYAPYGGKSLHAQSHGESFLSFFNNRLGNNGFFILDEPEAALSPQRQLSLLSVMNQLCKHPHSQFIIATHSPILLAYPHATIYSCDGNKIEKISYEHTNHYKITKQFLNNPDLYLKHLFEE